jgi:hypothetical protein
MAAYYTGEGATIAFTNTDSDVTRTGIDSSHPVQAASLSARTYCVRSMSLPSFERDKIDVSCLDSEGFKEYMASYLAEPGDLEVVVRFDGEIDLELEHLGYQGAESSDGSTEMTVTVTFDLLDGQATAASLSGSCFIKGVSLSEFNGTGLVEMTLSVCMDGRIPPAFTEATWTP